MKQEETDLFQKIHFIYLLLDRREGRKKVKERNIHQLFLRPATQACALTGNQTRDLSDCRTIPKPLSHISQGLEKKEADLDVQLSSGNRRGFSVSKTLPWEAETT